MGASILQIILKVTKEGTGDREAALAAKELKGSLKDLGLGALASVTPLAAVSAAVGAITAFTVDATKETIKYANEVRGMMQLTGQSAEESSRMLQVMDDLKVGTDVLTMATKTLGKEGLTMNIETLAKLSDEYNKLGTGAEKTTFLTKNFGKSGLAMAEAMEQGSTALLAMNDAVEQNLVLSQDQIDATRQLEREMDTWNDTLLGIKVTFMSAVIPAINDFLESRRVYIAAEEEARKHTELTGLQIDMLAQKIYEQNTAVNSAEQSYTAMAKAMEESVPGAQALAEAEKTAAEAAKEMTQANTNFLGVVANMQSAENSYAETVRTLAEERKQIEADKAAAIAAGWSASSQKVQEYDAALAVNSVKTQENAAEHDLATKKIVLGILQQKLTADGILDDKETLWLLEKGKSWGIYSQTVIDEAKKAIAEANNISAAINSITDQKTIDILIRYTNEYGQRDTNAAPGRALGTKGWEQVPAGFPNDTYPVLMTSGEKFAVIPAGASAPTNLPGGLGGGGGSVIVNANFPTLSLADSSGLMSALYPLILAALQRARSDGAIR